MPLRKRQPPTIRQYRRSDDTQIWALARLPGTAGPETPLPLDPAEAPPADGSDLADIGSAFMRSGGDFLVAEVDGHLVGTAGLQLAEDDTQADVVRVAVHPAVRRQGIGTALMEAIEHRAVGLGMRQLNLDVGENATDAIAFYLAAGFRKLDEDDDLEQRWDVQFFSKSI